MQSVITIYTVAVWYRLVGGRFKKSLQNIYIGGRQGGISEVCPNHVFTNFFLETDLTLYSVMK